MQQTEKQPSQKQKQGKCKYCSTEFFYRKASKAHLCDNSQCRIKQKNEVLSTKLYTEATLNEDYVQCQWCKLNVTRIYGSHMKMYHPEKTSADYKKEFPGCQLASKNDNRNIAKGYSRFAQSAKGRELFSERAKGQNNPNSKNNTTLEQRKERSPFSEQFYIKKGSSPEEATLKAKEFASFLGKHRLSSPQYMFWLMKTNGNEEEAKRLLSERQRTFTLEKCIEKYGAIKGRERWVRRQEQWIKNYRKKSYSFISQDLFWKIQDKLMLPVDDIAFATLIRERKHRL